MKRKSIISVLILSGIFLISCNVNEHDKKEEKIKTAPKVEAPHHSMKVNDSRISLDLNAMQKEHQLKNMRSHLEAVQEIVLLLSNDDYNKASEVAYTKLGSTTEMKLMCASFGDKDFENLGLEFHGSADKMSEIIKNKDKEESLNALSNTMKYCIQCHSTYKQ